MHLIVATPQCFNPYNMAKLSISTQDKKIEIKKLAMEFAEYQGRQIYSFENNAEYFLVSYLADANSKFSVTADIPDVLVNSISGPENKERLRTSWKLLQTDSYLIADLMRAVKEIKQNIIKSKSIYEINEKELEYAGWLNY